MAKTQIIWTILPYGISDNKQRVSVVVAPRLTPESSQEQVLGAFPEFLQWPEIIKDATFSAEINGSNIPMRIISKLDKDLWSKLFNEETPVDGFIYKDMSKVTLRSYSIRNILKYLKKHYANLAVNSPSELPILLPWENAQENLKDMLDEAWPKRENFDFNRFFDKNFEPYNEKNEPGPGIEKDLYQADRFYRRSRPTEEELEKRRPDFNNIPDPPYTPDFDFHSIIAALADYPELMRRLGLVMDFVLDENIQIPSGEMRLHIQWSNQHNPNIDVTPWTAFLLDQKRFITRPRTSEQKDGLLNLSNANDGYGEGSRLFDVYQVDPDGAALKTVDFIVTAQNLLRKHFKTDISKYGEITYTTGDRQGVAALRSGGLGVSQRERAKVIEEDIEAMNKNNENLNGDGSGITLYAEDVFRGYRVDVSDVPDEHNPGIWRTLCARIGDCSLTEAKGGDKIEMLPDEGYVYGASTTSEGPDSDEHYLHESLFRWTGWSLCTPRPGRVLKAEETEDGHIQSEVPYDEITDEAENGCGVIAKFTTPKGSLPRLRFGHSYRIRARVVDIAGNSLAMDDPSLDELSGASDAVGYWRFEPIDPPVLAHRTRVSEGESLERMVIRSNYDVSAKDYLWTEPFKDAKELPESQDFAYDAVNERHFVPPKSSQQQCEMHGLFDQYFGSFEDILKGYKLAARRESGTLYDGLPDDPDNAEDCPVKLITPSALEGVATTTRSKPGLPNESNPVGDRMAGGQYVVHGEALIATPWLPDGAAGGTAIRAAKGYELPGVNPNMVEPLHLGDHCEIQKINNEPVILVHNRGIWPDSCGFRLILAEREAMIDSSNCTENFIDGGEPKWYENENERVLIFFVPKGRIVRLVYASFANKQFIESFGIPQWVQNVEHRKRVYNSALHGANWLITPLRELTLVHATQAPVFEPRFNILSLDRKLGSHDVTLKADIKSGGITLHVPSTGKFEVEATWSEWVDDITKPEPERVEFKGQLGEIKLDEKINFEMEPNAFNLKDAVDAQLPDQAGDVQRSDVHALGDTRFRLIKYQIRATTRFREYLPPSIYADSDLVTRLGPVATGDRMLIPSDDKDKGAPVLSDSYMTYTTGMIRSDQQSVVLASAPPDDPRVLYVVPTMRWQTNEQADRHDVTRHGNGLRVWLDRPWFSSGDGELLGVVIFNGTFDKINPALQPLVTQWGLDPFWFGALPNLQIMETDFAARVRVETLRLQENTSSFITIIGHRVHWDNDRRLWYCDIALDPLKTYMPFVRLALVRYQPNAMEGAKISKVVLTDFAQVLPRRRATVKVESIKLNLNIAAALYGPNPTKGPMVELEYLNRQNAGRNRVELVLQTRDTDVDSDLAWTDKEVLYSQVVVAETVNENNPFWEGTATLMRPLLLLQSQPQPQRLMIREFERYIKNASTGDIEERLVFADIIDF